MRITTALLEQRGACAGHVARFRATFGESAALTPETWAAAIAAGLDVMWCVVLLSPTAHAEYDRAMAPARAEYDRAMAPAHAEYDRAMAPARAEYDRARVSALYLALTTPTPAGSLA